jgi:hypothetical protein
MSATARLTMSIGQDQRLSTGNAECRLQIADGEVQTANLQSEICNLQFAILPMSADSFETELSNALGEAYVLERELTGSGMSRVFVATEKSLNRQVVKVPTRAGCWSQSRTVPPRDPARRAASAPAHRAVTCRGIDR